MPQSHRRSLRDFFDTEVAGGAVLAVATALVLVVANSPLGDEYQRLLTRDVGMLDVRHWVNEGLMALFFFVVALEVKREVTDGELRDPRRAALPIVAAIGGMVTPAAIYALVTTGHGEAARGWGIPMATDIAFALGVIALVARNAPPALRTFLLTLAIVDDIGAIVVIALFYSEGADLRWLAVAAVALVAVRLAPRVVAVALGAALWYAMHRAGLHATLAGVAMAAVLPSRRATGIEDALHPFTSFLVVPVFALANAGIALDRGTIDVALGSRVTWGVVAGLIVGKTIGITTFSWVACRLRVAALPPSVGWRQLVGAAALGGIGFTVSLFITGLAFDDPSLTDAATIGVLLSSLLAFIAGWGLLRRSVG